MASDNEAMPAGPLRIGLVAPPPAASAMAQALAHWAADRADLSIVALIAPDAAPRRGGLAASLLPLLERLEAHSPAGATPAALAQDLDLPLLDRAAAGAVALDLIIDLGPGAPAPGLAVRARLGALAVTIGQSTIAPGLAEVADRAPSTPFAILAATPAAPAWRMLRSGRFPTQARFRANCDFAWTSALSYLKRLLAAGAPWPTPPAPAPTPVEQAEGAPSVPAQARYLLRSSAHLVGKRLRQRIEGDEPAWQVGFRPGSWNAGSFADARRIPNPAGRYLADPFVITREGATYCFVEDYDFARHHGQISVLRLGVDGATPLGLVLDEPFHLSFPFLLEDDGRLLMISEASASGQIRLYECVDFPLGWRLKSVLMQGVSAADTMVFRHRGLWWMLTCMDLRGVGDHCTELCAFSSETLEGGSWRPHPANPLVIDPERGRNGGLLAAEGALFRVAQRQGFDFYGKGLTVNRLDRLDTEGFAETPVLRLDQTTLPGIEGMHHLHSDGHVTVFDMRPRPRLPFP